MSKVRVAPTRPEPQGKPGALRVGDQLIERTGELADVEDTLLTLADIVILGTRADSRGSRFTITGKELAHLLSFRGKSGSLDASLQLDGLAELVSGHIDDPKLDEAAAYFLTVTLENIAARLEADGRTESFR